MENEKLREMILKHLFIIGGGREVNLEIADKLVGVFDDYLTQKFGAKLHVKGSEQATASPPYIKTEYGTGLVGVSSNGSTTGITITGRGCTSATLNDIKVLDSAGNEKFSALISDDGCVLRLRINGKTVEKSKFVENE